MGIKPKAFMNLLYEIGTCAILVPGVFAVQPSTPSPIHAPLRDIPWSKQINFLHTTDTHGWHAGHLQEASYGADWGDYVSFAHHLRQRADEDGSDLLLVDSGDRVEGNGLYDASEPKGNFTYEIFKEQEVDIIVCGNHELYKQNTSEAEYKHVVPQYKENYISSNIDILDPKDGGRIPLAKRFRKFKTKNQGIQIMAFGFIFDFKRSSDHAFVKSVEDTIKENWFQEAIRDRSIDLFVVAGHSEVRSKEFSVLFDEIRKYQWDTPIMFFGGHFHIRDYRKYDSKAYGIASGRYMETIGFQSISGMSIGGNKNANLPALSSPTFARRYIDNNLWSLQHHSGKDEKSFETTHGKNVTSLISSARHKLGLDNRYGCAPRDLWTNRVPYPEEEGEENSVFTWLSKKVLPEMVQDEARQGESRIIVANTGTIRFDIFKGPFTRDTTYIIQPFTNSFRYIPDVDYDRADKLLSVLNHAGHIFQMTESDKNDNELILLSPEQRALKKYSHPSQQQRDTRKSRQRLYGPDGASLHQYPMKEYSQGIDSETTFQADGDHPATSLTPGYTTIDDDGEDGDDTEHSQIPSFRLPNAFESRVTINKTGISSEEAPRKVDVVFLDFVQPWVLRGLKYLGAEYTINDTAPYAASMDFTAMISEWITRHWNDTDC